ncbi:Smr/MutS family protein [Teichococcus vastitatis]|jgi:DNA-nicking Smr family endonuclease|uniref:Smr/MutS family protein n=1 Tax=Teichococcus vastitatis TaxID=2307076 RepID=A0ABS9WBD3_9PROT|nr:Smr/MutS family protein [Pseudoroseomonas vastitatis]MCI0756542.1 Smr/MutS family protein [Pseudoroseomonas vastitatis]
MPRRGRRLTESEQALWRAYATTVTPLPGHALPSLPAAPVEPDPPPLPPVAGTAVRMPRLPAPPPQVAVGHQPSGLDHHRWKDLRRGRTRPERTLDLHGRRAQEAWLAVRAFLLAAHAEGLRCVAVVTGKGPAPEGGVLRRELPHWLNNPELRPLVLGAAHPAPNSGVVHLLLRRRRAAPPR